MERGSADDSEASPVAVKSAEEHFEGLWMRGTARTWGMGASAVLCGLQLRSIAWRLQTSAELCELRIACHAAFLPSPAVAGSGSGCCVWRVAGSLLLPAFCGTGTVAASLGLLGPVCQEALGQRADLLPSTMLPSVECGRIVRAGSCGLARVCPAGQLTGACDWKL